MFHTNPKNKLYTGILSVTEKTYSRLNNEWNIADIVNEKIKQSRRPSFSDNSLDELIGFVPGDIASGNWQKHCRISRAHSFDLELVDYKGKRCERDSRLPPWPVFRYCVLFDCKLEEKSLKKDNIFDHILKGGRLLSSVEILGASCCCMELMEGILSELEQVKPSDFQPMFPSCSKSVFSM